MKSLLLEAEELKLIKSSTKENESLVVWPLGISGLSMPVHIGPLSPSSMKFLRKIAY